MKYIIINNKQIVDWKARGRLLSLVLWPKGGVGGLLFNLSEEKWMDWRLRNLSWFYSWGPTLENIVWQSQTDTWDFNGRNIHLKSYYWASASLWERYYINYWGKDSPFVCTDFPPSHSLWLNNPLGDLACLTLIVSFLVRSTFTQEKNNDNLKFVSMRALLPSWQRFWRTGKKTSSWLFEKQAFYLEVIVLLEWVKINSCF